MEELPHLNFPQLEQLASRSDGVEVPCSCSKTPMIAWSSVPVSFPEDQLRRIGTLIQGNVDEASFAESHPDGSSYWSEAAPIAPLYYPYNRSDVWECCVCRRVFLRYTEAGGYFVDQRVRLLSVALLADTPLPD